MRIGITLNGVVRNLHKKVLEQYEATIGQMNDDNNPFDLTDVEPDEDLDINPNTIVDIQTEGKSLEEIKDSLEGVKVKVSKEWLAPPKKAVKIQREVLEIPLEDDVASVSGMLKFKGIDEYESFVFEEQSFELFGRASLVYEGVMFDLNRLYKELVDSGNTVSILSNERGNSKCGTLLFLSHNKCLANNFKFVYNYSQVWESFDMIITADEAIYKNTPKDKQCLKVITDYNYIDGKVPAYDNLVEVANELVGDFDAYNAEFEKYKTEQN